MKRKIKRIISTVLRIISIVCSAYIGFWVMFIQPITECWNLHLEGTLDGTTLAFSILKVCFAGSVAGLIFIVGFILASLIEEK